MARDMILQVDRVASVEEAVAFRDAGANLIGVSLDRNPSYPDERFVSPQTAKAIRAAIAPARLAGLVPTYFFDSTLEQDRDRIERVLALEPDHILFHRGGPPDELLHMVHAAGVPIIWSGACVDDDHGSAMLPDDPAIHVRYQFPDHSALKPALYQLEVLANTDPWNVLKDAAGPWPSDATRMDDLKAVARQFPILFSLIGVGPDTICPYVHAFHETRGFYAPLGHNKRDGRPTEEPERVLAALRALKANAQPRMS